MAARVEGVLQANDIESVHQMRVASRRLRVALRLFSDSLPVKKAKKWAKRVARVTRALGEARDLDVQISFVATVIDRLTPKTKPHQYGIGRLLLRLNQRRAGVRPRVEAAMRQLESTEVLSEIRELMRSFQNEARPSQVTAGHAQLRCDAQRSVLMRLDEMLAFEPYVLRPGCVDELHQMRIAAKHLRYTLETYAGVFDDTHKPWIKRVKSIQTQLGDIHDCDVWADFLPGFLEQEAGPV